MEELKMKSQISHREIRTVIAKLHNEGLKGNDFEATFCQYILETCGIDYNSPTLIYKPYPDVVKHRVNEVSKEKRVENIKYWQQRIWD